MAPTGRNSKNTTTTAAAIAEIPDTNMQLELIISKLTALESLPAKVAALEKLLHESNARNTALQQQIATKDKLIADLTAKTNSLEQYNRSWSVRLNNIHLPNGDKTETYTVMQTVFDKALRPIFEGAKNRGLITTIPDFDDVLETAHILPAKASDRPKPIIARFYSRNIRNMVFRLKKELAPTTTITTKGGETRTVLKYPIYEDLTKPAHQLLQDLLKDPRTGPVWTIGGHIRYRLKGDDTVRKVVSVFDSVEDILGS
jgi:hypothetical protein